MARDIYPDNSGYFNITNEEKRMMRKAYTLSRSNAGRPNPSKNSVPNRRATKAGGRAQPKGTPPRTGPGSGAGGGSGARYTRLTGGGGPRSHGR
jgi:hypothetical protein